jgi:protein phosphatase
MSGRRDWWGGPPGRRPAGRGGAHPDVSLHDAQAGDRYLLCSDGLTTVVSPGVIRDTLGAPGDPEQAVGRLIDLANEAGGPDNIACVVADVVEPRPGSD